MIKGVRKIVVAVDDQDKAKEFWVNRMGFAVEQDASYPGGRWLEVKTPDGAILLVLDPRKPGEARRAVSDELPHSDVFFTCEDVVETHRELESRGVRFHTPPKEMPWGWWSMFEDADGTRYVLQQG